MERNSGRNCVTSGQFPKPVTPFIASCYSISIDELNDHFSRIAISHAEVPTASLDILATVSLEGFRFSPVSEADMILAVSHFKSQVREKMTYLIA